MSGFFIIKHSKHLFAPIWGLKIKYFNLTRGCRKQNKMFSMFAFNV